MHLQHYHLIIICKLFHNNFKQLIINICRYFRVTGYVYVMYNIK